MKNALRKVSIVLNKKKTIDFKTFCSGGSPEYVAAKQRLKNLHLEHRKSAQTPIAYSLYINPAAFFDPTFILIGCGVVAVAVLEKKLAETGLISIASFLSNILRLALPGVALGSIIYLINHASFLL